MGSQAADGVIIADTRFRYYERPSRDKLSQPLTAA